MNNRRFQQFLDMTEKEKSAIRESHEIHRLGKDDFKNLSKNLAPKDAEWSNTYKPGSSSSTKKDARRMYDFYVDNFGPYALVKVEGETFLGSAMGHSGEYVFYDKNDVKISLDDIAAKAGVSVEEIMEKINSTEVKKYR